MRLLMVLPIDGAPGTLWGLIHMLAHGGTLFLEAAFDPASTVRKLADQRITVFLGVPVLYEPMAAPPEFETADLSQPAGHPRRRSPGAGPAPQALAGRRACSCARSTG